MKAKCFGRYQNDSFSLPLTCSVRGFFSDNYCENLIRLLELKLTNVWEPQDRVPWSFYLSTSALSLQQFISYSLDFHTFVLVKSAVSVCLYSDKLWFPPFTCLQCQEQWFVLCPLLSYISRRVIDVFSVSFDLLLGWSGDFRAPYIWNKTQKSSRYISNLLEFALSSWRHLLWDN